MKRIAVIDSTIREESKTRIIMEHVLKRKDVEFSAFNLNNYPLFPTNSENFKVKDTDEMFLNIARDIAGCDGLIIVAPFWDMSYPALLKNFFEKISVINIMFIDDGKTCVGISKNKFMLYITTRGMNIKDLSEMDGASLSLKSLCCLWGIPKFECVSAYNLDYSSEEEIKTKLIEASNKAERVLTELLKD